MKHHRLNKVTKIRLIIVLLFLCNIFSVFFYPRLLEKISGSENRATPTPPSKKARVKPSPQSKYANFQHKTHLNLKLACDSCHKVPTANWDKVRSKEMAFPDVTDYPQHQSCINCHRPQFFSGKSPAICSNCHTNPSPKDSSRHPFANPREIFDTSPKGKTAESDFQVYFPHDKHIDIVSQNENQLSPMFVNVSMKRAEESCSVCHQTYKPQDKSDDEFFTTPPKDLGEGFWLKKGTFKTAPIGHTNCFTCHSVDTGIIPAPTNCGTCHKPKQAETKSDFDFKLAEKIGVTDKLMLDNWKWRDASGKFRHEFSSHAEMSCSTCHNVATMNTADSKSKKVAVLSCSPCHITATSDDGGILNFEIDSRKKDGKFDCVKCHISLGKEAVPSSHTKAIESLK